MEPECCTGCGALWPSCVCPAADELYLWQGNSWLGLPMKPIKGTLPPPFKLPDGMTLQQFVDEFNAQPKREVTYTMDFGLKHCANCEYYWRPGCWSPERPLAGNAKTVHMIEGGPYPLRTMYASEARTDPQMCGTEARWYKPQAEMSWWKRLTKRAGWRLPKGV